MTKSVRFTRPLGIMGRPAGWILAASLGQKPHETAAFVSRRAVAPSTPPAGPATSVFTAFYGGPGFQAAGEPAGAVVGQRCSARVGADAERQREFGDLGRAW